MPVESSSGLSETFKWAILRVSLPRRFQGVAWPSVLSPDDRLQPHPAAPVGCCLEGEVVVSFSAAAPRWIMPSHVGVYLVIAGSP